jgi:thiamine kinase-like enzyme
LSYKNSIINYLKNYDKEYPLRFLINKDDLSIVLNNNYCDPIRLCYDPIENIYRNTKSNNLNKITTFQALVSRCFTKDLKELYVQTIECLKNIDFLKIGANQIHLINLKENIITHLLIPKSDSEWFLNDLDIQTKIQKGKFRINTPLIYNSEKTVPYFSTDFIKGNSYSELSIKNRDEIVRELFKFYSDQNEFLNKICKDEFIRIINEINKNMNSIDSTYTNSFEKKFNTLIKIIDINKINERNEYLFYLKIVHGDLNYKENVIKTQEGILYFIDWEMSRSANILYDYFYMLLYELNQFKNIENSALFNYFNNIQIKSLSQKVNKYLGVKIQPSNILDYFCLSILDMILYKILILKKKRIQPLYKLELKRRFDSLEKYLDKINIVLDKAINNYDNIN